VPRSRPPRSRLLVLRGRTCFSALALAPFPPPLGLWYSHPMSNDESTEQCGTEETEQRLQKVFQGAFSGPPTPLKRIPKRNGEARVTCSEEAGRTESSRRGAGRLMAGKIGGPS
jgi:hypothetical protein